MRLKLRKQASDSPNSLKKSDKEHLRYFQNSGSTFVLVAALSASLEEMLDDAIADKFAVVFGPLVSPKKAAEHWIPVVTAFLPLSKTLFHSFEPSFTRENLDKAISDFRAMVQILRENSVAALTTFAKRVKY